LNFFEKKFKKNRFFVRDRIFFRLRQKIPKLEMYYAKWTLRIELVNSKKNICYCIFRVYLVTGAKNPDISQEGTFRISKIIFYITTRGTLKDGQTQFLGLFFWTHIVSQVAVQCVKIASPCFGAIPG
jgi:hypothetical protein